MDESASMELWVVGAGGHGREMWWLAERCRRAGDMSWVLAGFAEVNPAASPLRDRYRVVSDDELLGRTERFAVVLGIGLPVIKLRVAERYALVGVAGFPVMVHPSATIDGPIDLAEGVCIAAGAALSGDIVIERFSLLNRQVTVGHDARIGAGAVINPGANISGGVTLGDGVLVGTGATVLQNLSIGAGATVGAGAVVIRDVPEGTTVVGVPASPLERR